MTCGKDGDARIWDFTLKRTVVVLSGHTQAVTCVKWGGDGTIYTGYILYNYINVNVSYWCFIDMFFFLSC